MVMMQECSFQPNLMATKSDTASARNRQQSQMVNKNKYGSQVPIHERVGAIQKEKNERL